MSKTEAKIKVVNKADDNEVIRVAVYKKPSLPQAGSIAWKIVAVPPHDDCVLPVPKEFQVFAEYSQDPNDPDPISPDVIMNKTDTIRFNDTAARFQIVTVTSQDNQSTAAFISEMPGNRASNEIRLENDSAFSVLSHIQKDGVDLYAPRVLRPGEAISEDLHPSLYLAVVGEQVCTGSQIPADVVKLTETLILEGGTAVVTGSRCQGYYITFQPPEDGQV